MLIDFLSEVNDLIESSYKIQIPILIVCHLKKEDKEKKWDAVMGFGYSRPRLCDCEAMFCGKIDTEENFYYTFYKN